MQNGLIFKFLAEFEAKLNKHTRIQNATKSMNKLTNN